MLKPREGENHFNILFRLCSSCVHFTFKRRLVKKNHPSFFSRNLPLYITYSRKTHVPHSRGRSLENVQQTMRWKYRWNRRICRCSANDEYRGDTQPRAELLVNISGRHQRHLEFYGI